MRLDFVKEAISANWLKQNYNDDGSIPMPDQQTMSMKKLHLAKISQRKPVVDYSSNYEHRVEQQHTFRNRWKLQNKLGIRRSLTNTQDSIEYLT